MPLSKTRKLFIMEKREHIFLIFGFVVLTWVNGSSATLSPSGVNYEVVALMAIKSDVKDPHNVLDSWDFTSVDPCSWRMVTCNSDGSVSALGLPGQNLSGTTLQNNAISGPITGAIGKLWSLQSLDLSGNKFSGELPASLGDLKNLNLLRLNNNSLTGPVPESLSQVGGLTLVDLSYNNLSGSLPKISARTFKIVGNPLLCEHNSENGCSVVFPEPLSFPPDGESSSGEKSRRLAIALGTSFGAVLLLILVIGLLIWWRYRKNQQIFFDVNDQYDPEVCLGHLRRFTFKELRAATDHFNVKNILGKGGFGIVYRGSLSDGTIVAVKRLKADNNFGGEIQFQTEVETISLAVHRNLLRLWGFCSTENERILVYPFMPNGSVKKLHQDGKLNLMVDKALSNNFDRVELEEMVQVALLCTQFNPLYRPKMSEVLRMLEGEGLVERWEASQTIETPRFRALESFPQRYADYIEESSLVVEAMELSGPR
ncbi:Concanavalin A-like lectin/glucanase, subgroup [Cynara cardunculus var. scolymus]|uniref:Concanavalin A-like lectin/glucanase, subgroup n=1 Tax=Cynara cardunculus var. scolymus TaxID=59895 RepID=A0A103XVT8_CYNCS|nr:Concanavalin A-like lectin/glucanase, subgroup [Cynara cardunculus var. scolymus]